MNAFTKRYYVWIALILLAFSWISFNFDAWKIFLIFAIISSVFCIFARKLRKKHKNFTLMCMLLICAALLGTARAQLQISTNEQKIEKYSGEHLISGYVADIASRQGFSTEHIIVIESIDGEKVNLRSILVTEYESDLYRGDFFECRAELLATRDYSDAKYLKNGDTYEYPLITLIQQGAYVEYLDKEFRLDTMLAELNAELSGRLIAFLGREQGHLASALLLGNRELLDNDILRDFKRAGVYHMLALSGLHVAILVGILEFLLKKARINTYLRIVVLALVSLLYIALTGFQLSACRSMLMLWVMYLSFVFAKGSDALTSLFVAVSIIVLIKPSAVLDVGLQLSFLSTLGVIASSIIVKSLSFFNKSKKSDGVIGTMHSISKKIFSSLLVSVCVFVATIPAIMLYFGEVSLATFVSNLFMGIVVEVFMIFALITLVLSGFLNLVAPFASITNLIGSAMLGLVERIADTENIMLSLNYLYVDILIIIMFIASAVLFCVDLKRKWLLAIPSVAFALLLCLNISLYHTSREGFVRAEYCMGDGIVLSSNEGVYICDASDGGYGDIYSAIILARKNCFTEIDGIILSHYHSNHLKSIKKIFDSYKIHSLYLPKPQNEREGLMMSAIVRELESKDVEIYIFDAGEPLSILSGELMISDRSFTAGYAHPSIAASYTYGDNRLTLIGKPYFGTYLEQSRVFEQYISQSDYIIFGTDGRKYPDKFDIFYMLKKGAEVNFSDFDTMYRSDFEHYLDDYKIYFNVQYKKYDLK